MKKTGIAKMTAVAAAVGGAVLLKKQAEKNKMAKAGYSVEEVELYRDGMKICGQLFVSEKEEKQPLVIMSHGFGANMRSMKGYAKMFAEDGIAAFIYDFIGGGVMSRSDGKMSEMSVLTEAEDLNTVLDHFRDDERFDRERIFLMGASQGGFVSTYVGGKRPEDVAGLIVLYPAYVIHDDTRKRVPDTEKIPDTMHIMGMKVGSIYNRDALSFDIYQLMKEYPKKVLIIHGSDDSIVPYSYSERAKNTFADAQLIRIEGANHGFGGKAAIYSGNLSLQFVKKILQEG